MLLVRNPFMFSVRYSEVTSFLERWNSVRSACFARLSPAGSNPASRDKSFQLASCWNCGSSLLLYDPEPPASLSAPEWLDRSFPLHLPLSAQGIGAFVDFGSSEDQNDPKRDVLQLCCGSRALRSFHEQHAIMNGLQIATDPKGVLRFGIEVTKLVAFGGLETSQSLNGIIKCKNQR
jgi:hypothetical protein